METIFCDVVKKEVKIEIKQGKKDQREIRIIKKIFN